MLQQPLSVSSTAGGKPCQHEGMAMTAAQIIEALGGRVLGTCPECGTDTVVAWNGQPSLCLSCTEAEIGERSQALAHRIELGMTRQRYQREDRFIARNRYEARRYGV